MHFKDLLSAESRQLTAYDTAIRLAAFLRLEPKRVYLHAGTRDGATELGFHRREWLLPKELPEPFRQLMPDEIEDCLCIYKREIAANRQKDNAQVVRGSPQGFVDGRA
jgi:hypothetical protein